jgi:hypothetical protein
MRVRPYNRARFEVDINRGDIASESGTVLLIGRPQGVAFAGQPLRPAAFEKLETPQLRPERRVFRYVGPALPWREVYSFSYRACRRLTPPESPYDVFPHYLHLINDLAVLLNHLIAQEKLAGDCTLGIVPFSWRSPAVMAYALAEELAGLFSWLRHAPGSIRSLRVVIRTLDEPTELYEAFSFDHYARFIERRGLRVALGRVWYPL